MKVSTLQPSDIIWSKNGDPALITGIDREKGKLTVDNDLKSIKAATKNGIKNGLKKIEREAYHVALSENRDNTDKNEVIDNLYAKVKEMKATGENPRLIRYLENELKFLMTHHNYHPKDYGQNPISFEI